MMTDRENWDGNERRHDITLEVLREMREWFAQHEQAENRKFDSIQEELITTRNEIQNKHDEIARRFELMSQSTLSIITEQNKAMKEIHDLFKTAFPEGNAEEHRRAHEAWIKKEEKEAEFLLDVKKKAAASILTGLIVWVGVAIWAALLQGPK